MINIVVIEPGESAASSVIAPADLVLRKVVSYEIVKNRFGPAGVEVDSINDALLLRDQE